MKGIDWRLVGVFAIINGLVLYNALVHEPVIQYDGVEHWAYIKTLASGRLPTLQDSGEFFSPPLPYILPAVAHAAGFTLHAAARFGQMINVLLSLGITSGLILLTRFLYPRKPAASLLTLSFLGLLPVYYKSMSYVRGEPYVAFFTIVALLLLMNMLSTFQRFSFRNAVFLGISWGLLGLSRQWGILVAAGMLAAVGLVALLKLDMRLIALCAVACGTALLTGGWFYGWLLVNNGSLLAFNREARQGVVSLSQPADFYFGTGRGKLFTDPIRPAFPNQAIPIFYAEIWGDYWGFFSVYGKDPETGVYVTGPEFEARSLQIPTSLETNRYSIQSYLGRVGLIGIMPSGLLFVSLLGALWKVPALLARAKTLTPADILLLAVIFAIICSALGYLWFLLRFPNLGKGDTIKATYMLHLFPLLALLAATIGRPTRMFERYWILAWLFVMLHNGYAMITHYPVLSVK